jgi:hypothetical protein
MVLDFATRQGHRMVVIYRAAADANGTHGLALGIANNHTAREGDHAAVAMLDVIKRHAGLHQGAEILGVFAKEGRSTGFFDGDIDGAYPGAIHAGKGQEVGAKIYDGNIYIDAQGLGFGLGVLNGLLGLC